MSWSPRQIKDLQFERSPSGYIIIEGQEVAHTIQCCHCNRHFVSVKGSGTIRGRCLRCNAITCGDPGCDVCIPWEKKLEAMEKVARATILLP